MDDQTEHDLDALTSAPGDLDGHTIDELADYVDAGRLPYDPTIEASASCRHAIAALERLKALSASLLEDSGTNRDDDEWVAGVLSHIALDAHAGADFRLTSSATGVDLVMTEGALRAVVRAAGDDQPGFLVGRIRFVGDLSSPLQPLTIAVNVTVLHGVVIPAAVDALRAAILAEVTRHTEFQLPRVDITVQDLAVLPEDGHEDD